MIATGVGGTNDRDKKEQTASLRQAIVCFAYLMRNVVIYKNVEN